MEHELPKVLEFLGYGVSESAMKCVLEQREGLYHRNKTSGQAYLTEVWSKEMVESVGKMREEVYARILPQKVVDKDSHDNSFAELDSNNFPENIQERNSKDYEGTNKNSNRESDWPAMDYDSGAAKNNIAMRKTRENGVKSNQEHAVQLLNLQDSKSKNSSEKFYKNNKQTDSFSDEKLLSITSMLKLARERSKLLIELNAA